ncbi:autotransporter outer membrane beta-barrel domain-containing protein [Variovorax sp. RKNM96]|uniref:autotransporter outer membrane beta-barrel domain-containing protein n=1 Tax=Variovorax sp. RKNM96 TaxID=2681552 RepID=UPI00197D06DF|nr:autotransporter outer membrane beta-barrel domain-containing protein [Variovorax sp. RKNM96]QSI30579.1 autotransporter outer membrane beta-barrel domain-containing protein [Variovorax sp. RKNM96]
MNRTYKSLWNAATGAWVAVSENASARGKRSRSRVHTSHAVAALLAVGAFGMSGSAQANCVTTGAVIDCSGVSATPVYMDKSAVLNNTGTLGQSTLGTTGVTTNATIPSTINNSGTILGEDGIGLNAVDVVNNAGGHVTALRTGIIGNGGAATLRNTGGASVEGTSGYGVLFYGGGSVLNAGNSSIVSKAAAAIALGGAGEVVNEAGSTITGVGYAVLVQAGNAKLSNAGQMNGAVDLRGAVNDVTLFTGSQIDGFLLIDAANNTTSTLTLTGAGTQLYSQAVTGGTFFGGKLVKDGIGTWTLDRAIGANSVDIQAGTLAMGLTNVFNASTPVGVGAGATLDLRGFDQTFGSLAGSGNVALGSAALSVGGPGVDTVFSGTVSGKGSLAVTGGTLALTGNNTFEGGLAVNRSTLLAGSDANLGAAGSKVSLNDGTLRATGAFTVARDVFIGGVATIDTNGFDLTLTGALRYQGVFGQFEKDGLGTLTLESAGSDYVDPTIVNAGTLALKGAGTVGRQDVSVAAGATIDVSQTTNGASLNFLRGAGTVAIGSKTLTTNNASSTTQFDGVIQDGGIGGGKGGALHILDAGSWTLTQAQTYTGGTTLDTGNLYLTGNGALAAGTALTLGDGALFDVSGSKAAALTLGDLNGGTSSIVLGDKALTLGTANDTVFAGGIEGAGATLVKQGTGTLMLDGFNTYTGLTSVQAGKLVVGGDSSTGARLSGAVDVASGATLGGRGRIGGDVALASGAHLAPGNSIGTLTIDGSLDLAKGSVLDFEFGAPGGSFSVPGAGDSVAVGGNLTLSGATLNVTDTGGMGAGLYRLFSYGGTLTQSNGGIALGSVPAGGSLSLQYLAASKQVNLINTAGLTLNYWNGNGLANASQMGGGDGTWSTTQPNWTDATGSVTSVMQPQPAFAIFGGAAGKVVVDKSAGAVSATGMQFASDGYRLSGDTITLVADKAAPGPVEVRVGDGSAGSSAWNAGIANVIAGTDGVLKTGAGTLALSGANTYSGGTTVRGGALQIGADNNLGAASGGLTLDGGTLRVAGAAGPVAIDSKRAITLGAAGGTLDLVGSSFGAAGGITGGGGLTVQGNGGILSLTTANSYAGSTTLQDGASIFVYGGATLGQGPVQQQGNGTRLAFGDGADAGTNSYRVGRTGSADSGNVLSFDGTATASTAKLSLNGAGWQTPGANTLVFGGASTAASATITNLGGTVDFTQTGNAGSATIFNGDKSLVRFANAASAGSVNIGNLDGGTAYFADTASAANAQITNAKGGTVDVSGVTSKAGIAIGALSGAGGVVLGATQLTVGGLNTSDVIAGVVSDKGSQFAQPGAGTGGSIVKVGSGTLTLSGANTYTGGTALRQGRLNVGHSQALGTGVLTMDDDTTLGFGANNLTIANAIQLTGQNDPIIDTGAFNGTLGGAISGGGFITKQGTGTLTLSGANSYTGATNVAQGSLKAGVANTFSAGSAHSVATGATLDLAGFSQTVASLANSGTVSLAGAVAGTTLTVNGNYVGTNGVLKIGTALNSGAGPSDRLVINGGSATGKTSVQVTNLGGLGAFTTGNGIEVITAQNGATTTAQTSKDAFALAGGHVDAGAYEYRLNAGDAAGAGENWYLRSDRPAVTPPTTPGAPVLPVVTYRAEASLYAALPSQLRQGNLAMLGDLRKRVGDDDVKGTVTTPGGADRRAWARVLSTDIDIQQGGTVSPNSKGRLTGFQAGTDLLTTPNWRAGLYVGQLDGDARVNGFASGLQNLGVGRNDLRSQYVGIYGTYTDGGFYADAVVQTGRHRYTVQPNATLGTEGKGNSLLGSIELGQAFALGGSGWSIEPQMQLIHQHMDLNNSAIAGAVATAQADSGWIARAGVRVKGEIDTGAGTLQPYGRFNVYKTSSGADVASFLNGATTTDILAPTGGMSTELAGGFTLALGQTTSLYGEIGKLWASGGNTKVKSSVNGSLGVRVKW